MQRTVKGTRFTYVENTLTENNEIKSELKTVEVMESNEDKALKKATKAVGHAVIPVKTETFEKLYVLDDDIFFQYAKVVE